MKTIDLLYIEISKSFIIAAEAVSKKAELNNKKNKWWTSTLTTLKNKINTELYLRKNHPSVFSPIDLKNHKKEFRKQQRKNIYLFQNSKVENIDALLKCKNKEKFWLAINKLKNKKEESINPRQNNVIKDHFQELFSETSILNSTQIHIQREVLKFENEQSSYQEHSNQRCVIAPIT
jgi:hypothetical protein